MTARAAKRKETTEDSTPAKKQKVNESDDAVTDTKEVEKASETEVS